MAKLYFWYAAMNSGKSTQLLQAAFNYEELGRKVKFFTAAVDDRIAVGVVGSRIGLRREVDTYKADTVFSADLVGQVSCVFIDEAQFLSKEQVVQLHQLANLKGIPVICAGLRSDFRGEGFAGSIALLTLADELKEIKTICPCSKKGSMNMKVDADGQKVVEGPQVCIGGNERFRAVCPSCFYSPAKINAFSRLVASGGSPDAFDWGRSDAANHQLVEAIAA